MNKTQTPDDVAAARLQMITPLLETNLDPSQLVELKKKVAQDNNISYRSVGRYMNAYLTEGFAGLKPKTGYKRTSNTLINDTIRMDESDHIRIPVLSNR